MADTLNICVASVLTGRQSSVLREERSAGRLAYFRNGQIQYNNRPPPRNKRTPTRRPDSPSAENREGATAQHTAQHVSPTYDTSTFPPLSSRRAQEDDRRPSSYNKRNNDHDFADVSTTQLRTPVPQVPSSSWSSLPHLRKHQRA